MLGKVDEWLSIAASYSSNSALQQSIAGLKTDFRQMLDDTELYFREDSSSHVKPIIFVDLLYEYEYVVVVV
jgi:hypothetical protein